VEIVLDCRAGSVHANAHGGVSIEIAEGKNQRDFDGVVVTLASPLAARICASLNADERARMNGVEYQGIICASLLLDEPISNYYVTNITDTWVPFTGVIEMTALVDRAEFDGRSLVYLPKYVPSNDVAFELSDSQIESQFIDALRAMYPAFARNTVRAFRISRVRYVMPITTLEYSNRLPPVRTSVEGLYTVNSAHIVNGTLNVNETVQLANRAAQNILHDSTALRVERMAS
jgi:protoporphyrinogen oxidase